MISVHVNLPRTMLVSLLLVFSVQAYADTWKASVRGARENAHYLINSETGVVAFMRGERCVQSYAGKMVTVAGSADARVQVDSEFSGGNGPRGTQRLTFTLREGRSDIGMESSLRGTPAPLPADYVRTCNGKSCAVPVCE